MRVQVQSIHFDADEKLLEFVQRKADKLCQFFDKIIDCQVYLKVEKNNHTENKVVEFKLKLPGKDLFIKNNSTSFEVAVDLCTESLKKQLKKIKGKTSEHVLQSL